MSGKDTVTGTAKQIVAEIIGEHRSAGCSCPSGHFLRRRT
jgi:hypothetical protein